MVPRYGFKCSEIPREDATTLLFPFILPLGSLTQSPPVAVKNGTIILTHGRQWKVMGEEVCERRGQELQQLLFFFMGQKM